MELIKESEFADKRNIDFYKTYFAIFLSYFVNLICPNYNYEFLMILIAYVQITRRRTASPRNLLSRRKGTQQTKMLLKYFLLQKCPKIYEELDTH